MLHFQHWNIIRSLRSKLWHVSTPRWLLSRNFVSNSKRCKQPCTVLATSSIAAWNFEILICARFRIIRKLFSSIWMLIIHRQPFASHERSQDNEKLEMSKRKLEKSVEVKKRENASPKEIELTFMSRMMSQRATVISYLCQKAFPGSSWLDLKCPPSPRDAQDGKRFSTNFPRP